MKTDEIRQSFLDFFKARGHKIVASDSLVPQNDPTLLFTGAGMNQFKEYFLELKKDLKRVASSQKCLRTGDLDEVGKTAFHHSFFEMLGNFSFGDYFKREAIQWAWEFLTKELALSKDRLRVSVHQNDKEALKIWRDEIKVRPDWIYQMGDKSNFWPSNAPKDGPNGPCGPCSEIYFDQDPSSKSEDVEGPRFAEIWNLVFTQFDRQDGGKLAPLAQKNIDTGMGLERLACVVQGKKTNFEIDIFEPINEQVLRWLNIEMSQGQVRIRLEKGGPITRNELTSDRAHLFSISDHARAIVFALADGVIPSNEGRSYVIRKLIRRALWHAHLLRNHHLETPFLYGLIPVIGNVMKKAYPEIATIKESLSSTLQTEEERFLATLERGLAILDNRIKDLTGEIVPGKIVFELYDTYGFPDELTRRIANEKGFEIDQKGFDLLMEEQREKGKQASRIATSIFVSTDLEKKVSALPATKFLGYSTLETKAKVLLAELQNREGVVVLNETPFYAESGGQVGDQGILENSTFKARVTDTQKKDKCFIHHIETEKGNLKAGDEVSARVDRARRDRAIRNHTATHLLHAALRSILGTQVRQLGSLVAPERLRFDYSYAKPLSLEQLKQIEDLVNSEILKNTVVTKEEKPTEEAKKDGAIAFFGEKYGDKVRVVTVPGFSKEFCGGTHCDRTGQIGFFVIVSDTSIGSGIRRMEALTGEGALDYVRGLRSQIARMAETLKASPSDLVSRVTKLQEMVRKMEKGQVKSESSSQTAVEEILNRAQSAGAVKFSAYQTNGVSLEGLRRLSDEIRSRGKQTVFLLASKTEEKIYYLLGSTGDLKKTDLDLLSLFKELSPLLEASGGGRKDLVQGGGTNPRALAEKNWATVTEVAINYIRKLPQRV